ncbi:calcium-binding protein E63-1-like isoform X2 [Anopheles albimanus]|uniref:calcium-binding protein E63-1-like isoform X2 n=1 Tax=Anopheles albimanus TaxID=7167 RepID=UPI00163E01E0|nr:calcium-binding protein E63-1-like isoform X2 [Anopheles albimanus]
MSSSLTMGAAGRNPSATLAEPAGSTTTTSSSSSSSGDGGGHSTTTSHSDELSCAVQSSSPSSTVSSVRLPALRETSGKAGNVAAADSNFLTPQAAREGTPPRADAQIELGSASAGCVSSASADSGSAGGGEEGAAQPKTKVIRKRIIIRKKIVKKMKKKDEKFYLRTAFDLLDRDQDGHVTPEELQFMLRNLGIHVRDELIDDLLREASRTGSGLIDETEFLQWVARIQALKDDSNTSSSSSSSNNPAQSADDDLTQDLVAAFRVFDRDGNGYITRDELKSAMDMIGENVTEYQLNEMLELADADKDGRINYEEFARLLL